MRSAAEACLLRAQLGQAYRRANAWILNARFVVQFKKSTASIGPLYAYYGTVRSDDGKSFKESGGWSAVESDMTSLETPMGSKRSQYHKSLTELVRGSRDASALTGRLCLVYGRQPCDTPANLPIRRP